MLSTRTIAASSLLMLASVANAGLIVDWGQSGAYASGNTPFNDAPTLNDMHFGGFSGGDPLPLNPAANYNTTLNSARFYGIVNWTATGADGNFAQVQDTTNDRIEIKRYNANLTAVLLWRKADFLDGYDASPAAFDSTSTATMNINTLVNFESGRAVIRLQGGAQDGYYISQQQPFNGTGVKTANLTSLTWLAYDPANALNAFGGATNLLDGGEIKNVTEVGFYTYSNATSANAFRLDNFEVTAVPEPASIAALALAGLSLLRRRRR